MVAPRVARPVRGGPPGSRTAAARTLPPSTFTLFPCPTVRTTRHSRRYCFWPYFDSAEFSYLYDGGSESGTAGEGRPRAACQVAEYQHISEIVSRPNPKTLMSGSAASALSHRAGASPPPPRHWIPAQAKTCQSYSVDWRYCSCGRQARHRRVQRRCVKAYDRLGDHEE